MIGEVVVEVGVVKIKRVEVAFCLFGFELGNDHIGIDVAQLRYL